MPYDYTVAAANVIPNVLQEHAGATLTFDENPTAIPTTILASAVGEPETYNLQGQRVDASYRGVIIIVQRMSDGTVKTSKIIR